MDHSSDADYVAAACFLVGAGLSLFLLAASLVRGVRTSPTQFAYYAVATICCAITLRYAVDVFLFEFSDLHFPCRSIVINDDPPQFVSLYSCTVALNAILLFLNCFADREPVHYDPLISEQTKPSPYFAASVPSKLTYDYVTGLLWKGFRDGGEFESEIAQNFTDVNTQLAVKSKLILIDS